ncbi:MAG: squalene/phytoene synthase family protein [Xanthomonadaceae bacterium]|nr:squalene/phytoene synthase family protein [Xanthomonadaceae bacterium]
MVVRPSTEPAADRPPETGLDWCRRRFLVAGHPLSMTLPYAAEELRDALLGLNAIVSEIAAIPGQVGDAGVARRKLQWWQQALVERQPHPAIQAWIESGASARVGVEHFEPLILGIASEIEPPRFEQMSELDDHCRRVAGPGAALEARLVDGDDAGFAAAAERLASLAAASYRVRMVRDLVLDARHQRWLVPLELQAEYQLTRQQVAEGEGGHRLDALARHLLTDPVRQLMQPDTGLDGAAHWRHRHALLRLHLDGRLGRYLVAHTRRLTRERVAGGGIAAAFSVWRHARRLRRLGKSR